MLFQLPCARCGEAAQVMSIETETPLPDTATEQTENGVHGSYVIDCPRCGVRTQPARPHLKDD